MKLDVHTLFLLTMYVEAILGLLLFLAWVQHLGTRAMAWWGGAYLVRCMSIAVYGMYGVLPNFVTIELAGALLFTSYGIIWAGARVFNRRPIGPGLLLAGAVAWMAACRTPVFESSEELRNLLSAAIIAGYSAAAAYELWRGRTETLVSRWPAIVLLGAHAALFLLRTPLTFVPDAAASQAALSSAWLTVLSPEALLFTIAIAFVLLAMGKERAELGRKLWPQRIP